MRWSEIVVLVVAFAAVAGWLTWRGAQRLDRLHRKVVASRIALDAQLVRRSVTALDLATSGVLDPASSMLLTEASYAAFASGEAGARELAVAVPELAAFVHEDRQDADGHARTAASGRVIEQALGSGLGAERARAESDLSVTLRAILDDPEELDLLRASTTAGENLQALTAAWYRVQLARRFHNEAVAQAQRVRRKTMVRVLRLAGRAPLPQTVDLDDGWPRALGTPGESGTGRPA